MLKKIIALFMPADCMSGVSVEKEQSGLPSTTSPSGMRSHLLRWWRGSRLCALGMLFLISLVLAFLVRCVLLTLCWGKCAKGAGAILLVFATGLVFDVAAMMYFLLPFALYLFLMPQRWFAHRWNRRFFFGAVGMQLTLLVFSCFAEYFFWDEFGSRFNFIAVDYLIYTTEVLGNIWQSYNVPLILLLLTGGVGLLLWGLKRSGVLAASLASNTPLPVRLCHMAAYMVAVALFTVFLSHDTKPAFGGNMFSAELAGNGIYSFFAAFRHNQLDYHQFYRTMEETEADRIVRNYLQACDGGSFLSPQLLDFRRTIHPEGPEHLWNVIFILQESFSAHFTGVLGNPGSKSLTPCFDALSEKGLLLERCFASGTRTVRGIEAVMLSAPPTPGQSIVKRKNIGNLPTMGRVFREHGYRNTFIYGGSGFFDNMNAFFSSNGYDIMDRMSPHDKPRFSNIWGVCDQDLYDWALKEADAAHAEGKPFHQFILTTSNHRPYTFPAGAVDAPQRHRSSAVRYMDFAMDEFIRQAQSRPWFANTLFVVVADHCHSTSGRAWLPMNKYHIPALFYGPGLVEAGRVKEVCSQIDMAPTIFGLLNWQYVSEFFGRDVRKRHNDAGRAFPGTFQLLGYLDGATGIATMLMPHQKTSAMRWSLELPIAEKGEVTPPEDDVKLAVALYQSASKRFARYLRRDRKGR